MNTVILGVSTFCYWVMINVRNIFCLYYWIAFQENDHRGKKWVCKDGTRAMIMEGSKVGMDGKKGKWSARNPRLDVNGAVRSKR